MVFGGETVRPGLAGVCGPDDANELPAPDLRPCAESLQQCFVRLQPPSVR